MDKIRNIEKYINTIKENSGFFETYYFHSLIDLNLVKIDSMLKNGILSKNLIEQKKIISLYTHDGRDFDSKNGNSYVSLTKYIDNCQFSAMFESFTCHTLTCLSLLIDKDINIAHEGERETYFEDEIFCLNSISKEKIQGIILPDHLSHLYINQVNCLPSDLSCYTKIYINHWINCMQSYFKQTIPIQEIRESLNQFWSILEEYECPEKWTEFAIRRQRNLYGKDLKDILANILQNLWSEKLGISNPKYIDVLMRINEENLPIYEIKQKCLKRIN